MKKSFMNQFSLVLALLMCLQATNFSYVAVANTKNINSQAAPHTKAASTKAVSAKAVSIKAGKYGVMPDCFSKQYFSNLVTNMTRSSIAVNTTIKTGKTDNNDSGHEVDYSKGVVFSGKQTDIDNSEFTFNKAINFGEAHATRFQVDGLAYYRQKIQLSFFIDDTTDPFFTTMLPKQKKKNAYTYSKVLTAPIDMTGSHTVKMAVSYDGTDDAEFLMRSIEFVQETVPVISFDLDETEGSISAMNSSSNHVDECYGHMNVSVPAGFISEYSKPSADTPDATAAPSDTNGSYELEYIRGRGNSTWDCDKKPYKLKLASKSNLFGMGANKHWVLLANWYDASLLRNKATYWMGTKLGMAFTPKSIPVDVIMNGEYLGSYYLTEHIRVGKSRVNIDDLEDTKDATDSSINTGGYLLCCETDDDGEYTISTSHNHTFSIKSPSFDTYYNEAQYNYINNYMQSVDTAIHSGGNWRDLLDEKSMIDYFWMQEFSANGDAYWGSSYLYKPRNDKLYMGPLWDFDYVAWGSCDFVNFEKDENGNNTVPGWNTTDSFWNSELLKDKSYSQAVADRWPAIKAVMEEAIKDGGQIDQYAKEVSASAFYNYEKWEMVGPYDEYAGNGGNIFGMAVSNNPLGTIAKVNANANANSAISLKDGDAPIDDPNVEPWAYLPQTYSNEVQRFKDWIRARITWVDQNISFFSYTPCKITFKVGKKVTATVDAYIGKEFTNFPSSPKKKGYTFSGWYTDYRVDPCFYPDADTTLKAKWIKNTKVIKAKQIFLNQNHINAMLWEDYTNLSATIVPFNATNSEIIWKSSNTGVATVDPYGMVTFEGIGETTITAKTINGLKSKCKVVVSNSDYDLPYIDDFKLSKQKTSMKAGAYQKLNIIYSPEDAMYTEFNWNSTNPNVAEVTPEGVIHALKSGTAIVYAFSPSLGVLRACQVRVKATGVTIDKKHFPDDIFRAKVKKFDKNKDGALSSDEVAAVKKITICDTTQAKTNMTSVKGIQHFTSLTRLNLRNNNIKSLDLKANKKLTYLNCGNNNLVSLDLTPCTKLKTVIAYGNGMKSIALKGVKELKTLSLNGNRISKLDVSPLRNLTILYVDGNKLTSLDASKCDMLKELSCCYMKSFTVTLSNKVKSTCKIEKGKTTKVSYI